MTEDDIRDIKPIYLVTYHLSLWWYVAAAIVVAMLCLLWYLWRRHKKKQAIRVQLPAHIVALQALAHLQRNKLSDIAAIQTYCFHASEIIRTYIEHRFLFNATDLTSEEIYVHLPHHTQQIAPEDLRLLKDFLQATDIIKYFKQAEQMQSMEPIHTLAVAFIDRTKPQEQTNEPGPRI